MTDEVTERVANEIIGLAIKVHRNLGPAYEEKIYQKALQVELEKSGHFFEREKLMTIIYDGVNLGKQTADFVVDRCLVLELKKVDQIQDVHKAQLLSYLRTLGLRLGLVLNFGSGKLEVRRVII